MLHPKGSTQLPQQIQVGIKMPCAISSGAVKSIGIYTVCMRWLHQASVRATVAMSLPRTYPNIIFTSSHAAVYDSIKVKTLGVFWIFLLLMAEIRLTS